MFVENKNKHFGKQIALEIYKVENRNFNFQ